MRFQAKSGKAMRGFRFLRCLLVGVLLLTGLTGCTKTGTTPTQDSAPDYESYRDIPGVTEEEIAAVEELRDKYGSFVYGSMNDTEAFDVGGGELQGFSVLLCDWMSDLFGIPFKPVVYEWTDLIDGLATKEIAFTSVLTATDERKKTYFMTDAILERSIEYFRMTGSENLSVLAESRPLRYSFLEGTTTPDLVLPYCTDPYEIVYVGDYETAYQLLKSGDIDAFFDEGTIEPTFDAYGDVVAETFLPLCLNPASLSTQNPELEPIIAIMQKALDNGANRTITELYNLGQKEYVRHKLLAHLTTEEQAYINEHIAGDIPIPVGIEFDNYPVSFYNEREGEWQGTALDVLGEIESLTGLRFERPYQDEKPFSELLRMLETGEVSLVSELIWSRNRDGIFLWSTISYQTDNYALLSKREMENVSLNEILNAKIGTIRGTAYDELFFEWFPNHPNVVVYENFNEAFAALESGEIDLMTGSQNLLLSITNYQEHPGFKANFVFNREHESVFGFNRNEPVLLSIVDKSLELIDTEAISGRWTRQTYDYREKMAQNSLPWIIGVLLFVTVALVLVAILLWRKRKEGDRLARIVDERTRELALQTEAARDASDAKSEFLASMSHEIRTPMNAITGMALLAKSSSNPERTTYCLGKIENASTHLLGIINDILDMSKIEAHKLELAPTEFNFERMLQNVVNVINYKIEEKQQTLAVYIGKEVPHTFIGDDQRLAQVITNLFSNAVKFTPEEGTIELNAHLVDVTDDLYTLRIEVSDTGIGLTEEQISRLFSSFEQADKNTSKQYGGTGLGLAISKRIVEMMGGEITVESEYGEGTTFIFTVKLKRGPAEHRSHLNPDVDRENLRILVVETDTNLRNYIGGIVQGFGIPCDTAANGEEALSLIWKIGPYSLCFMDWKLPELNKTDLARKIREIPGEQVIIAMMPLSEWDMIEHEAKAAGISGFIPKPPFPSSLAETINKYLGASGTNIEREALNEIDDFSKYRILLAEDIDVNREILVALLEPTALKVDCAENGAIALQKYADSPDYYNLIFMDVQMPQMDGYEATRKIRALEEESGAHIPIVAMTANVFREDIDKCLAAGMDDHVGKPLDFDDVLEKLRHYMTKES
jgi:signal transduction histidine kinase/CheY-like chemotaxis protein